MSLRKETFSLMFFIFPYPSCYGLHSGVIEDESAKWCSQWSGIYCQMQQLLQHNHGSQSVGGGRILLTWRTSNSQVLSYQKFQIFQLVFPFDKVLRMKETRQKKIKDRDGICEKWELSSESEVPVWKFPNISLLSFWDLNDSMLWQC